MDTTNLLTAMKVFIAVADSGSFSEAARRLSLSQPSVSRQVNTLEEHLGVRLLQRSTRKLSLTEAGQVYCEKARQIQRDVAHASQSIACFKDSVSGTLRISVPWFWAEHLITPYLPEFLTRYPDVKLDLHCSDSRQDVVEDGLDLVIRVGTLHDTSYIAVPFADVKLILVASPNYCAGHDYPLKPSDLLNHNCLIYENLDKWSFEKRTPRSQSSTDHQEIVQVSGHVNTNAVGVVFKLLEQGHGIALLPDMLVTPLISNGSLQPVMTEYQATLTDLEVTQMFAMYSNRKHLPAKTRAFIDFLKAKFKRD